MRLFSLAAVLLATVSVPAFAEDLAFTLVNNSSLGLIEMYLTPHDSDQWGDNILNVDVLAPGQTAQVSVADGQTTCDYDLRFVMDNGNSVDGNQDLCKLSTFTLHD